MMEYLTFLTTWLLGCNKLSNSYVSFTHNWFSLVSLAFNPGGGYFLNHPVQWGLYFGITWHRWCSSMLTYLLLNFWIKLFCRLMAGKLWVSIVGGCPSVMIMHCGQTVRERHTVTMKHLWESWYWTYRIRTHIWPWKTLTGFFQIHESENCMWRLIGEW
jgi:hypothetical protein